MLLIYDQVASAQQVIQYVLIRESTIRGQVDVGQHDLLTGFENPRITIDIDTDRGIAGTAVKTEFEIIDQRTQLFTLKHIRRIEYVAVGANRKISLWTILRGSYFRYFSLLIPSNCIFYMKAVSRFAE